MKARLALILLGVFARAFATDTSVDVTLEDTPQQPSQDWKRWKFQPAPRECNDADNWRTEISRDVSTLLDMTKW